MMQGRYSDDARRKAIIDAVEQVAKETGRSPAEVAIAWLLSQNVIPIIGARRLDQFEDNMAAATLTLTPEQLRKLDGVSKVELGFPHDMVNSDFVRSLTTAGLQASIVGAS
jgi:aryl-alcohol dehydrogenase-like predicted oxidoreductase